MQTRCRRTRPHRPKSCCRRFPLHQSPSFFVCVVSPSSVAFRYLLVQGRAEILQFATEALAPCVRMPCAVALGVTNSNNTRACRTERAQKTRQEDDARRVCVHVRMLRRCSTAQDGHGTSVVGANEHKLRRPMCPNVTTKKSCHVLK